MVIGLNLVIKVNVGRGTGKRWLGGEINAEDSSRTQRNMG